MLTPVQLFATSWTVAHHAPLSMEFSSQEYWSGLPFPTAGDIPDPGIEPSFLAPPALAGGFFTTVLPSRKPQLGSLVKLAYETVTIRYIFPNIFS